jgi:hypothetical protein
MSTTYTSQQLATRVLKDTGLYAPDETPSAADLNDAVEVINSEIAAMAVRGIAIWGGSYSTIPIEYLTPLSRRLGLSVGPAFGLQLDQAALAIEAAEMYLRQVSAKPETGAVQEIEYF